MREAEYVVIQEGETVECSGRKQMLFEPAATVRIGFGGYSTVYKEVIPAGHFRYKTESNTQIVLNQVNYHLATPLPVARKWFPYTPDFDREFRYLETLNSPPNHGHKPIIKQLAVVIDPHAGLQPPTSGKHSLLFPLADLDLEKYPTTEDFSRFRLKDLMKELFHFADALSFLHNGVRTSGGQSLVGSHMDLKPSNILIFRGQREESTVGTWKISDFSTSTLTDEDGHDYLSPPKLVPETYSAPEIQVDVEENKANPACDIWSLGCIIFEVLLGYVEGKECKSWKDRYGNMRCYYEREGEETRVERRVWEWLNADVKEKSVGMCKQLVMDMLRTDPEERLTAEQVRNRLEMLLK